MGGRYLVFGDRIELRTIFGWFKIAFSDLISLEKVPKNLTHLGDKLRSGPPIGMKLDMVDLVDHLELLRKSGMFRRLCFTPDDLDGFLNAVRRAGGIRSR